MIDAKVLTISDAAKYTIIGATLAILASILNAIGYTIQKKGHNRLKKHNQNKQGSQKKRLIKEKTWIFGFGIYLIGGILNAISLFYAPQSLVLPLSAITLVANTLLSTKVLDEPFFKADLFGILSVLIGSVLAVIFGPKTAGGEPTMNELKLRWIDRDFFTFFIILSLCIVLIYLIVRYYEKKQLKNSSFLCISYCLLAGYFGSLAFLFLKSFTEFIGTSIASKHIVNENTLNWYSYVTLICVIVTNIVLEFFRQRGLSYFNAVYVVPINQVILIVMGTILGGLYFEEFDNMHIVNGIMFCVAILLTVIGVFILALNSGKISATRSLSMSESTDDNSNDTISDVPDLLPSEIYGLHRAISALSAIRNENRGKNNSKPHVKRNKSMPVIGRIHEIEIKINMNENNKDDGIII